jgi:hypothetical protein
MVTSAEEAAACAISGRADITSTSAAKPLVLRDTVVFFVWVKNIIIHSV